MRRSDDRKKALRIPLLPGLLRLGRRRGAELVGHEIVRLREDLVLGALPLLKRLAQIHRRGLLLLLLFLRRVGGDRGVLAVRGNDPADVVHAEIDLVAELFQTLEHVLDVDFRDRLGRVLELLFLVGEEGLGALADLDRGAVAGVEADGRGFLRGAAGAGILLDQAVHLGQADGERRLAAERNAGIGDHREQEHDDGQHEILRALAAALGGRGGAGAQGRPRGAAEGGCAGPPAGGGTGGRSGRRGCRGNGGTDPRRRFPDARAALRIG